MMAFVCPMHGFCEHDLVYCACNICWNPILRKIEGRALHCQYLQKGTTNENYKFKFELRAAKTTTVKGYYNLTDSIILTNTFATGEGIIGYKALLLKNRVFISPEKIMAGEEIVLKARNRNIVDLGNVLAEFRTNDPIYSLSLSKKKVSFNDEPVIHLIPNDEDRKGPWETLARDRFRFQRRIKEIEKILRPILRRRQRNYKGK